MNEYPEYRENEYPECKNWRDDDYKFTRIIIINFRKVTVQHGDLRMVTRKIVNAPRAKPQHRDPIAPFMTFYSVIIFPHATKIFLPYVAVIISSLQ